MLNLIIGAVVGAVVLLLVLRNNPKLVSKLGVKAGTLEEGIEIPAKKTTVKKTAKK
jgi:hypothetical protein